MVLAERLKFILMNNAVHLFTILRDYVNILIEPLSFSLIPTIRNALIGFMNIWHTKSYVLSGQLNILQIIRQFVNHTTSNTMYFNLLYYNELWGFLLFGT